MSLGELKTAQDVTKKNILIIRVCVVGGGGGWVTVLYRRGKNQMKEFQPLAYFHVEFFKRKKYIP